MDVKAAYEHEMAVTNVADDCLDEVADNTVTWGLLLLRVFSSTQRRRALVAGTGARPEGQC